MFCKPKKEVFDFIGSLMLILTFFYAIETDVWFLLFIGVIFFYWFYFKISLKMIACDLLISIIGTGLLFIWHELIVLENLAEWIDNVLNISIRGIIINFVNNSYEETTSSFIKLILFNEKTDISQEIYYKMKDLSIVYLIAVSGFHLGFLKSIINFACFKKRKISYPINVFVIFFYCYLLEFSVSSVRVWICLLLSPLKQKFNLSSFNILCLSGLIIMIISPMSLLTLSFQLSYLATFGVLIIYESNINNKILETILANISAILITFPIIIGLNQEISVVVLINSFIFSYFICFIFVFLIITFWMFFLAPVLDFVVSTCYFVIGSFWNINVVWKINCFPIWITINFYYAYFCVYFLKLKSIYANN